MGIRSFISLIVVAELMASCSQITQVSEIAAPTQTSIPVFITSPTPSLIPIFPTFTTTLQNTDTPTPSPTSRASSLILWSFDFADKARSFGLSLDQSVGCAAFPIQPSDVNLDVVEDVTTSSNDKYVLELTANATNKGGLFVNAIAHHDVEFIDDSRYIFEGYFKKVASSKPEQIDVNLQLVEDYTEHYAEIIWTLNPYHPLYGWVWTRMQDFEPVKLFRLPDDVNWHYFQLIADYRSNPKSRYIRRIQIDEQFVELDLEMGTIQKAWKSSFITLLETHNMYTNCDPNLAYTGKSRWEKIGIRVEPLSR